MTSCKACIVILIVLCFCQCSAFLEGPANGRVQTLRGSSQLNSDLLENALRRLAQDANPTVNASQTANATNATTASESSDTITRAETMGAIFAGIALVCTALVHAILAPAKYRLQLLMSTWRLRLKPERFSRWAPAIQWVSLVSLILPLAFTLLAARQVASELWRVATLGSLVAAMLIVGSLGLARLIVDSFRLSWPALVMLLLSVASLAGFVYVYIWVVEPFSFVGTSVVLLCLSSVPSISLAFLQGQWQSTRSFLSVLTGEKAAAGLPSALPRKMWQRVLLSGVLWLANLGMLGVYGYAIYSLHPDKTIRFVGVLLAAGVAVLDALVWAMWSLGLVHGAKGTAALMVAARIAACIWGEKYWLIGHSGVFLVMLGFLAHLVVDLHLPSPNSPAIRRRQLAAEMLDHLKDKIEKTTSDKGDTSGDKSEQAVTASAAGNMKQLHCLFHPLSYCFLLTGAFTGEIVAVTIRFDVPDISTCGTCVARPQQYYAGIALGGALVYALSLYAVRYAQHKANGRRGPLLELAPLSLVVAYFLWVAVGIYTSWVVDGWAVAVHVSFVPLIAGLFWSGYQRWVEDDYELKLSKTTKTSATRVAPAPASDHSTGTSDPAGGVTSGKEDPASDAGGILPAESSEHATADSSERNCLQKVPWTLRIWILALVLDIAYGATFHGVVAKKDRWIGWTCATMLFVLSITFMSNRLWFGTYRKFPEQPVFCSVIFLTLLLWAGLIWLFHLKREFNYFFMALLCVVVLYPAAYLTLMAFQVWRDAQWKPDQAACSFIRNSLIISALIYVAFLGTIAYWYWAVALCGFSLLGMICILALSLWLYYRNNRFISPRAQIVASLAITLLILVAAGGYMYFFQSIFGGFSIACGGLACILMLFWLLFTTEAKRRSALERLIIGVSDIGFPIKRLKGGDLTRADHDVVMLLAALVVAAVWGLVASAVLSSMPSVGIVVGVLSLMSILVLLSDRISRGGFERAQILSNIPESEVLTAAKDALGGGLGADPTISSTASAVPADSSIDADEVRQKLIKTLQKFGEKHKLAVDAYQDQIKTSCVGRFHTFPLVSVFQTLNVIIASFRDGKGCTQDHSPEKPHDARTKLFQAYVDCHQSVVAEQDFIARLQLCLLSAQSQRLWARESEFRAFLQEISSGSGGLTLEDFKQLPQQDRASIEAAWEKWKLKETEKNKEEEERRKQEEEAARRRKEEQRKRLEEARKSLEGAMADEVGDIEEWKALIAQGKESGLPDIDKALLDAQHKLAGLEKAEKMLREALAVPEDSPGVLKTLQDAVDHAVVAGLESVLIRKARDGMSRVQGAVSAAEEEERKRQEAERLKKLKEEQERRRKQEEERRKQEELERRKTGQPKVIAVNLEQLKNEAKDSKDGKYTDKVFTHDKMGATVSSKYQVQRLTEIAGDKVQLYVDGWSPGDINQGELGDCWFLSAIACVAQQKTHLDNLIRYADTDKGLYVVRFYKSGAYQDVAVDDLFPTKYGQCAFASSGTKQEAWVQVLEKAYAKLHGSYDSIEGGFVNDALVDMTGGIGEQIRLQDSKAAIHDGTLWSQLKGLNRDGHLLGCGSSAGSDTDVSSMGIVQGHAYSILRVDEVDGHRLMKVRNPWGATEWKGKWSDGDSASWTQRMKTKLGYVNKDDGAFWMAFEDFVVHFRNVYICRVFDDSWNRRFVEAEWKGTTAGGCRNNPTYENNPKIFLQVKGRVRLMLTCEQEDPRGVGAGDEEVPLGFRVYKHGPLSGRGFAGTPSYAYYREVCVETDVAENSAGPHYIIPTTWNPGVERKFTMKVFWKGDPDAVQLYT